MIPIVFSNLELNKLTASRSIKILVADIESNWNLHSVVIELIIQILSWILIDIVKCSLVFLLTMIAYLFITIFNIHFDKLIVRFPCFIYRNTKKNC
jgi:hypothetical protein